MEKAWTSFNFQVLTDYPDGYGYLPTYSKNRYYPIPSKLLMISGTHTYSSIQLHTVKNSAGFSIQYIHFLIVVGYSPSIS